MSKTVEEVRRELFEAWALDKWPSVPLHRRDALPVGHERYDQYVHLEHEWQAFNAALDAVEIKLKAPHNDYSYSDSEVTGACKYYDQVRAAIEQTGLGLKVKP